MPVKKPHFALNHMVCPHLNYREFAECALKLGMDAIELRNDIGANSLNSMDKAIEAGKIASGLELEVLTINALGHFNIWNEERAIQAEQIADLAQAAGVKALILCPLVDENTILTAEQRKEGISKALSGLHPILKARNLHGYVEALGFPISTLRYKKDALEAIKELGLDRDFFLVHDTFHHKGAGESQIFPNNTGLVHISGVEDASVSYDEMLDSHRILIGKNDRLDNVGQIRDLLNRGYKGYFSFEPFSEPVWNLEDPIGATKESIDYIIENL